MYSPLIDILFGDFIISKKYIYGIFIFIELTLNKDAKHCIFRWICEVFLIKSGEIKKKEFRSLDFIDLKIPRN